MNKDSPLLRVRDLRVGYEVPGDLIVPVENVSFDLNTKEVVGLIGDAGSGKSTAALALMGMARLPGKILGGSVQFDGRELLTMPDAEIRAIRGRDIGIIVQNPRAALNPMLRVGRQIGFAYRAHNDVSAAASRAQAIEMLRFVGINDPERRVEAYAHELSGGMAQRALIAMALSSKPRLLIADEPTSGLDVTIQAQFLDEMWQTVQKTGSAMLLVTQELGILANFCDRVLVLHKGRIVEDAPVRQFFAEPQHPYSQEVLRFYHERSSGFPPQVTGGAGFLQTKQLTKHFPLRGSDKVVQAVDNVTISVAQGQAVGLVGESGSGKTTVGRCLMRLEHPTTGSVILDGQDITKLGAAEMRQMRSRMQIVFQDPFDSVNPRWTVADILDEPLRVHEGGDKAGRRQRAVDALKQVDLDPSLMVAKPRDLGASTLQRINIARALICNPDFVVLDEPTSVLAPRARNSLIALLARLQKELGISYLFISHDLTTVRYLCQRVAVMYLGQIVEEGSVEQVFTAPQHPYSRALLSAHLMPDPTHRRVDNPVPAALEGEIPSPIDVPKGCYLASRCPHVTGHCRANPQVLTDLGDARAVRCERVVNGEISREPEAAHD
jgi:peptide/nickel transport system ATP-binding protein